MSDFTHLHVHSHYSLLDGLGTIDALVARAQESGMKELALTDHGAMYGVIEFVRIAQAQGIKPILGMEAYLAPHGHSNKRGKIDANPRHLTLLAQNLQGYRNLIHLSTLAHLHGYYYRPRIDYELLKNHSEGLIVLSGCINSDISQAIIEKRLDDARRLIEWHLTVFGRDRFYFEVQHHPTLAAQLTVNEALQHFSHQYNVRLVATADTHYIHPEDAEAQDVLVCVQTGKTVNDKDRLCMLGEDFSLKTPDEMKELWKNNPDAIDTTQHIAEMCVSELTFDTIHLPHYPLPPGQTTDVELQRLCEQHLLEQFPAAQQEVAKQRLDYELSVIKKTGFASYFLIVADFVNEAKRRDILVGPGRGSAAGSIVSYLLNITTLDPLRYNLLFERFLNPERVTMPDIDLDFADDRRDEVIDYVREKYGHDHVAQIITFGTMAARAAVRDAGRALGFPYSFCDRIAKAIPPFANFDTALATSAELKEMYRGDPQAQRLIDTARKLEGVCRHASTHAAGVVITEQPLTQYVPLQLSSTSDSASAMAVTQYAMHDIEALGLLKIDFLGLKNLTIIQHALRLIEERHSITLNINALPLNDTAPYQLLQRGRTTGVFQLESAGMKRYLKELQPTEFEDIISILALYRPGPMDSIPDFIAAKHGRKKITYLHQSLKQILEKTYGVIVTQDQVLQIAREFAGFTYAEADILRKAVGKKIKELLAEQQEKFIQGAMKTQSVSHALAQRVWEFIEPFARYGFNRAHAACYAMIAYQTAYLKANFPAEFMASLMTSDEGNTDRQAIDVAEALSMEIAVLPPDINESDHNFTVVVTSDTTPAIRVGLGAIKHVGHTIVSALIAERTNGGKFVDLFDVFRRIDSKYFNRKSAESLIKAGAFDRIGERNHLLHNLDTLLKFNRSLHKQRDGGQRDLFDTHSVTLAPPRITLADTSPAVKEERLAWEKELLGLYISEHPLSEWHTDLQHIATPLSELAGLMTERNTSVRVAGVVTRMTKILTKSQQPMLFVQLEDMVGKVEVLVFPSLLSRTSDIWHDGATLFVEGKISDKDGELKILADNVWKLTTEVVERLRRTVSLSSRRGPEKVVIRLQHVLSRVHLQRLQEVLAHHHTEEGVPVELLIPRGTRLATMQTSYRWPRTVSIAEVLTPIIGAQSVRFHER